MIPGWRGTAIMAGVAGISGIILAAMGSHLDGGIDDPNAYRSWQSASMVHLLHAAALLGLAALGRAWDSRLLGIAGIGMAVGILLFCGSIYFRILAQATGTVGLAPIGGICLMLSWLLIIIAAVRRGERGA